MRHARTHLVCGLAAAVLVACAKASANAGASSTGNRAALKTGAQQWTGHLQSLQARSGGVGIGTTTKDRTFGNVSIARLTDTTRYRARLSITVAGQGAVSLPWSIYSGRCGSGAMLIAPIITPNSLPRLEVNPNGSGEISAEFPATLSPAGEYHVNVFLTNVSTDMSGVLACANLKLGQ